MYPSPRRNFRSLRRGRDVGNSQRGSFGDETALVLGCVSRPSHSARETTLLLSGFPRFCDAAKMRRDCRGPGFPRQLFAPAWQVFFLLETPSVFRPAGCVLTLPYRCQSNWACVMWLRFLCLCLWQSEVAQHGKCMIHKSTSLISDCQMILFRQVQVTMRIPTELFIT
jgi:hypothetical protein